MSTRDHRSEMPKAPQQHALGIAELGLVLREELYAGQRDALNVLKQYCEGNILPPAEPERASEVGQTLRAILESI